MRREQLSKRRRVRKLIKLQLKKRKLYADVVPCSRVFFHTFNKTRCSLVFGFDIALHKIDLRRRVLLSEEGIRR